MVIAQTNSLSQPEDPKRLSTLIHPTAVIQPGAEIHPSVRVGAYAVIGDQVTIGAGTEIGAHAVIDGWTTIGEHNRIFAGAAIGQEPQDLKYDGTLTQVRIGDHNLIREYVTVNRAARSGNATVIGNGNLLMAYVHVAHDCVIENQVVIANNVAMAGHVHIESRATIGGVVGIHQFVQIGKLAMVGGMSRIDRDVPPYTLVEGNPCRVRSLNQVGLKRAGLLQDDEGRTGQLLKKAYRILYRSGLSLNAALEELDLLPNNPHLEHLRQFLHMTQASGRRGVIPAKRRKAQDEV